MHTEQIIWTPNSGWHPIGVPTTGGAQLVLAFGAVECLRNEGALDALRARYPHACVVGSSTSGEIADTGLFDGAIVATAIEFERSHVAVTSTPVEGPTDSSAAGLRLAAALPTRELVHVMVFSEGVRINGSQLVEGLEAGLPADVGITGGLAGDGTRFADTVVVNDGRAQSGMAVAVGLYGTRLAIAYASVGGWDPFGPERVVTGADGAVLHGLDGQSALALYKKYLGVHADGLPASALLFPLSVRRPGHDEPVVRTVLGVDEAAESMRFAGDVPMGSHVRLMKATVERVIEGAIGAAQLARGAVGAGDPSLALLVTCVGRRLVLKQRTEEELEAVRDVLGPAATITGFYSYGEIAPARPGRRPNLHNQTMTVTTVVEQ